MRLLPLWVAMMRWSYPSRTRPLEYRVHFFLWGSPPSFQTPYVGDPHTSCSTVKLDDAADAMVRVNADMPSLGQ